MKVKEAIEKRRAYRSLKETKISEEIIEEIAKAASLAPSCFNKQPWKYVFINDNKLLTQIKSLLSKGNEWARKSSLIIAVFSSEKDDCIIKERKYHLFDTGMATAFLILRATEMGLVAHPIAGFDNQKVKNILNIPKEYELIALLILGEKSPEISDDLSDWQKEAELKRPERKDLKEFAFINKFNP